MLDIALYTGGLLPLLYSMYVMYLACAEWVYTYSVGLLSGEGRRRFRTEGRYVVEFSSST